MNGQIANRCYRLIVVLAALCLMPACDDGGNPADGGPDGSSDGGSDAGDSGADGSPADCGDGVIGEGEECDDGPDNGVHCDPPPGGSCQYCSDDCDLVTVDGDGCGDGECSDADETCASCPEDCGSCPPFLPDDRSIDWRPGLQAEIPDYPVSENVRDHGAVGDGTADDTEAIRAAMAAAADETAVLLPAGTYRITSTLRINRPIVLRGEGVESTTIVCGFGDAHCIAIEYGYPPRDYTPLVSGYERGSTEIEVEEISGFEVGAFVEFRQDNDPALMADGYSGSLAERNVGQFTRIVAITGNTLTIERPLHYGYNPAMSPGARHLTMVERAGLEDFRLEVPVTTGGSYGNFGLIGAASCWLRNIWSDFTLKAHVYVKESYACEIRDSVFNDAHLRGGGGQGYGVGLYTRSTDILIENNIFYRLRHSMVTSYGSNGSVFAYNYSGDPAAGESGPDINDGWLFPDICVHGNYPYMNLFEGNVVQQASMDNVHGTNAAATIFRNRILRESAFVQPDSITRFPFVIVATNNYRHNIIANELGSAGQELVEFDGRYTEETSGTGSVVVFTHLDIADTILVHGNYDYPHATFELSADHDGWEESLSEVIPFSLFHGDEPGWWPAGYVWPPFGPEQIDSGNRIPAWDRFDTLRAAGEI